MVAPYVRNPTPTLTAFFTRLTGTPQVAVDAAEPLDTVLEKVACWLGSRLTSLAGRDSWGALAYRQLERELDDALNIVRLLPHTLGEKRHRRAPGPCKDHTHGPGRLSLLTATPSEQ